MQSPNLRRVANRMWPACALALSLLCALLGLYGLAAPVRAQADPAAAERLGSVQGRVTDEAGAPLAGMKVGFLLKTGPASWSEPVLTVTTELDGQYTATLRAGVYILRYWDPQGLHAQQYYSHAQTLAGATDIVLMGNDVQGVDARLGRGGSIAGKVSSPLWQGNQVGAYMQVSGEWQLAAQTAVDAAGHYQFGGLPAGVYHLCLQPPAASAGRVRPCYDRIASGVSLATDVVLRGGSAITGIDIAAQGFRDVAIVSGQVTDEAGTPLAGVWAVADSTGNLDWNQTALTRTNAAGFYQLPLPAPDSYRIRFENPDGVYQGEHYMDRDNPGEPGILTLAPYERRDEIDAQLALGGLITGNVSFTGLLPTAAVGAVALDTSTPWPSFYGPGVYDPLARQYQLGGLPPGHYRVCGTLTGWISGCYPGGVDYASAADVTVTAGSTLQNIDLVIGSTLPTTSVLSGTVSGPAGEPLAGIRVDLINLFHDAQTTPQFASTLTAADGSYRFEGIMNSFSYRVRFTDPVGVYATMYYSQARVLYYAQFIKVEEGRTAQPIDSQLELGGAIGGQVQALGGQGVAGAKVTAVTCPNWECSDPLALPATTYTDADGRYSIRGLAAGSYSVCAQATARPLYPQRCYGAPPGGSFDFIFVPVNVVAGRENTAIDIYLVAAPLHSLYLPFVRQ